LFQEVSVPHEPPLKRTVVFVDGQNLFHSGRESFGYMYPNCDVRPLAQALCRSQAWDLSEVRFYTGVPDPADALIGTPFGRENWP
jgi:hypothetical protein